MQTPTHRIPAPPLHAELRRFALQVQLGFAFTLGLSLFMLVLQS